MRNLLIFAILPFLLTGFPVLGDEPAPQGKEIGEKIPVTDGVFPIDIKPYSPVNLWTETEMP